MEVIDIKRKWLINLNKHLTNDDIKQIEILYGDKIGLGLLEKCESSLKLLDLLSKRGFLESEADYQFLLDAIGKPNLLGSIIITYDIFSSANTL